MEQSRDSDEINRLWEHALHEDNLFNDRLNFFLVFESVLVGVVGVLFAQDAPSIPILRFISAFGLTLTVLWLYIQAKQKHTLDVLKTRAELLVPEFKETIEQIRHSRFLVSGTLLLAYFVPGSFAVLWMGILVVLRV